MTVAPAPMRVMVVTTSFRGGGAEFVALTWAGWLAGQGHTVGLATTTVHDDGVAPDRVTHIPLEGDSTLATVRALRAAVKGRFDVILSLQSLPNLVSLAAARGLRRVAVVISERNITSRENEPLRLPERVRRAVSLRWYRRADLAIAVSHAVGAELVSAYRVPADRVVVVPNPAGQRAEARGARETSAEPDGVLRLALPMRLVPQKRVNLAVDAAAVLRARGIDARLLCFTTKSGMADLAAHAEASGVPVESPGWVDDWAAATPVGSVVVLPSYREGFGNILVEAAQAGFPSVAVSNSFGVGDALVPGVSGQFALVGTADALADAVESAARVDMTRARDWGRRFSTSESGRLLTDALISAIHRIDAPHAGLRERDFA